MSVVGYLAFVVALIAVLYVALPTLFGAPWWPTPQKQVFALLKAADLKEGETLYDLGCGDGRVLIWAARRFNVRCVGVEIDPLKASIARMRVRAAGLSGQIEVVRGSAMDVPLHPANVVFLYLSHQLTDRLLPKFQKELSPDARIASYGFMVQGLPIARMDDRKQWFVYKMGVGRNINRFG